MLGWDVKTTLPDCSRCNERDSRISDNLADWAHTFLRQAMQLPQRTRQEAFAILDGNLELPTLLPPEVRHRFRGKGPHFPWDPQADVVESDPQLLQEWKRDMDQRDEDDDWNDTEEAEFAVDPDIQGMAERMMLGFTSFSPIQLLAMAVSISHGSFVKAIFLTEGLGRIRQMSFIRKACIRRGMVPPPQIEEVIARAVARSVRVGSDGRCHVVHGNDKLATGWECVRAHYLEEEYWIHLLRCID